MGVYYEYTDARDLLFEYSCKIRNFEREYLEHYKDVPVEEIQG